MCTEQWHIEKLRECKNHTEGMEQTKEKAETHSELLFGAKVHR